MAPRKIKNVSYDFSDQVVVVTGAARGQGRAHALMFAAAGAHVVASDIDRSIDSIRYPLSTPEQLASVAQKVEALGVTCLSLPCDVRDTKQVAAMIDATMDRFGRIDVLVNNAGIESVHLTADMPEAAWDDLMNTNLRGMFLCCKYAIPHMINARRGRVINTGSANSFVATPNSLHYVAAKHGVLGLTKALAVEVGKYGITVNAVCPGAVDTGLTQGLIETESDWISSLAGFSGPWNLVSEDPENAPMMDPQEISHAVLWLASDAAHFVTGTSLLIDGGMTAK